MLKRYYFGSKWILYLVLLVAVLITWTILCPGEVNASKKTASSKISKIVKIAVKKKGKGINSFPSYFHNRRWCADFVYWSAKKAKLTNNKIFPKSRKNVSGYQSWYKKKGLYKKNTKKYSPKKGDLVFLSTSSHIGIVAKVTKKYVYIIHGNWSNKVKYTKLKKHGYTSSQRAKIKGYATPAY